MTMHARPLEPEDGPKLVDIDQAYARSYGLEPRAGQASLRFFARTGHAFVAIGEGGVRGFVLAQPVFDGERATVVASRLATAPPGDADALRALLRALVKSAYDAGVYDLRVDLPNGDRAGMAALADEGFAAAATEIQTRQLGSRAAAVASAMGSAGQDGGEHG